MNIIGKLSQFSFIVTIYHFVIDVIGKNKIMTVKVHGQTMNVNVAFAVTLKAASGYLSERLMTEIFMGNLKKDMVVIDVGAHMGYYTLLAAEAVGNGGKVFSFEPEQFNFSLLEKNIKSNHHFNVIAIQKAVMDISKSVDFYIKDFAEHSVIKNKTRQKTVVVDAVSLDDFFSDKDYSPDVIKIDVEGAEMSVLKGAGKVISRNPRVKLFIEFSPRIIRKSGHEISEFLDVLYDYGFNISVIDEENYTTWSVDNNKISAICKESGYVNLFCQK